MASTRTKPAGERSGTCARTNAYELERTADGRERPQMVENALHVTPKAVRTGSRRCLRDPTHCVRARDRCRRSRCAAGGAAMVADGLGRTADGAPTAGHEVRATHDQT